MFARLRLLAVTSAVAAAVLSSSALAQAPALTLGVHGRYGSIGVTLGSHFQRPSYTAHCSSVWVPGHYENRCERVYIAGCSRQVWVPAAYEWRWDACGHPYRACVSIGHWSTVTDPGHYETRESRAWVAGRWESA